MLIFMPVLLVVGAAVGLGLESMGSAGKIIFWLVMAVEIPLFGLMGWIIAQTYLEARKAGKPFKVPYGSLTEYVVLLTWFSAGLALGYWVISNGSAVGIPVVGAILAVLAVTIWIYAKGDKSGYIERQSRYD